jgi:3-deoxy-D-manno-octulosonic-acid transferase
LTIKLLYLFNVIIEKLVLSWAKYFSKTLKERFEFESENLDSLNYYDCHFWFHVSSEGELEQVLPFIKYLNNNNEKILLIYTSPSVEKKVLSLEKSYSFLKSMRYPLFNGYLLSSLPVPRYFFMVRYDFFPRLLLIANNKSVNAVLLSATRKNKSNSFLHIFWAKRVYSCFNKVFWSSEPDNIILKYLTSKNVTSVEHDFRHSQIIERQLNKKNLSLLEYYDEFIKSIEKIDYNKRIIIGSAWSSEVSLLMTNIKSLINKGFFIYIAPHHLKGEDYEKIKEVLLVNSIKFCETSSLKEYKDERLILSSVPGVLCEIYTLFKHSFVGGGHGRSVHSLLEPYWAGCDVYCGPKVHRSTEFDYIVKHDEDRIHVCEDINGLEEYILKCDNDKIINSKKESSHIVSSSNDYIINLCDLKMDKDS